MKKSLKPFKVKVRMQSRAEMMRCAQRGEDEQPDRVIQLWGDPELGRLLYIHIWMENCQHSTFGVFEMDGTPIIFTGGDFPVG